MDRFIASGTDIEKTGIIFKIQYGQIYSSGQWNYIRYYNRFKIQYEKNYRQYEI